MRSFTLSAFLLLTAVAAQADVWVDAPTSRSLDGNTSGKTQFRTEFGKHRGTYPAMFESILENRDKISGDFLVARYRYTYATPIGGGSLVPRHDEAETEVLLDCRERLAATRVLVYRLSGEPVDEQRKADSELRFMYFPRARTVDDLCAFARERNALP